jgi:hypothetical protein
MEANQQNTDAGGELDRTPALPPRPLPTQRLPQSQRKSVQFQDTPETSEPIYQQQQAIIPPETTEDAPFSKSWHMAKIVLGIISLVSCTVVLVTAAWVAGTTQSTRGALDLGLAGGTVCFLLLSSFRASI